MNKTFSLQPPVPKPRAHAAAGQQVPNGAHLPYHPVPAPRSHPSPVMTGAAPKPPPARPSVQARYIHVYAVNIRAICTYTLEDTSTRTILLSFSDIHMASELMKLHANLSYREILLSLTRFITLLHSHDSALSQNYQLHISKFTFTSTAFIL